MEVEVRRVGKQDCFAALPHALLEAFLSNRELPAFPLVLELRVPGKNRTRKGPWFVAWDGSASRSSHIEVAEKFAECIGLEDGTRIVVRARSEVSVADTVAIEPASEDDWEILELNAEFLEEHLVTRVGVLYEGQRFPVWVESGSALVLQVVSTSPSTLVRLGAGTELVVAPKKRQVLSPASDAETCVDNSVSKNLDPSKKTPVWVRHTWLRVQDLDPSFVQPVQVGKLVCFSVPTTAIFLCPVTARQSRFTHGQLVVLSETLVSNSSVLLRGGSFHAQNGEQEGMHAPETDGIENADGRSEVKPSGRRVIARVVVTKLAKQGHVMLGTSLQTYLGLNCHARIGIQACRDPSGALPAFLDLIPTIFDAVSTEETMYGHDSLQAKKNCVHLGRRLENMAGKWSTHKDLITLLGENQKEGSQLSQTGDVKNTNGTTKSVQKLIQDWVAAQTVAFSSGGSGECEKSVPVSEATILHLRISYQFLRETQQSEGRGNKKSLKISSKQDLKDLLFLIGYQNHGKVDTSPTQGMINEVSNIGSKRYILLEERMFSGEDELFSKDTIRRGFESKGGLAVKLGSCELLPCRMLSKCIKKCGPTMVLLRWLGEAILEAYFRLKLPLSPTMQKMLKENGIALPGAVLLYGPPACGKTTTALALAQELQTDPSLLAHRVVVSCNELVGEQAGALVNMLHDAVSEALDHAPALIILDDLDALLPKDSEGPEPATAVLALSESLGDLMDLYQGGRQGVMIAFLATARSPMAIPDSLCFSGRFDYHVELPTPAASERATILEQAVTARGFLCRGSTASEVAANLDGADGNDLEVLVDRAVHAAAARFLSPASPVPILTDSDSAPVSSLSVTKRLSEQSLSLIPKKFELNLLDFNKAEHNYVPSAMQGITKGGSQVGRSGWDDVGGLLETRRALQEILELPVKYGEMFRGAPLRLRSGVLLYGPPGCGKTHIVGAAAAACSLRFISVKGPELLNKYIGASEQAPVVSGVNTIAQVGNVSLYLPEDYVDNRVNYLAAVNLLLTVRDVFAKAAVAAPALLFFDEFDSIAPRRGHDNTGVTDRVVNQLLTELDGVEALNGVFVFAATSRPDLLDAALLRPGRLDRMLLCGFPSTSERAEILQVLSRKLSLAGDVDLETLADLTEGFSAADLQAVCSDAQLESVHSFLANKEVTASADPTAKPVISMLQLRNAALNARPSVPEVERRRLNDIYASFMDARKSTSSKSRDREGKRATLA